MASKGDLGIELELDKVPCEKENMTLRNDAIWKPRENAFNLEENGNEAKKIFDKWDLDFVVIGKTANTNNLTLKFNDKVVGESQLTL